MKKNDEEMEEELEEIEKVQEDIQDAESSLFMEYAFLL